MDKLESAEELGYGAYPVQLRMLHYQPQPKEPFHQCKGAQGCYQLSWTEKYGYFETKSSCLKAQHATMKAVLTDEHQLYCLAVAESSVDCQWDRVIFSDKYTFS
jgi:hypothetical protein